jgi:glutamate racemase
MRSVLRSRSELPVAVFDSGLGGLTVVQEMRRQLPQEAIVYLGDSARVPYGTRSPATVVRYASACARFLLEQDPKLLVVACNTASAVALPVLNDTLSLPVLGVISAGARAALARTKIGRIGVVGTAGTINSGAYPREISAIDSTVQVFQMPAPLFVPLAEEGWVEGEVPLIAAQRYLAPLVEQGVDVILLGCTHYPLLRRSIEQALARLGSTAEIVDSATAMAARVGRALDSHGLVRPAAAEVSGALHCFVTDAPANFSQVASRFLGEPLDRVEVVDIS